MNENKHCAKSDNVAIGDIEAKIINNKIKWMSHAKSNTIPVDGMEVKIINDKIEWGIMPNETILLLMAKYN